MKILIIGVRGLLGSFLYSELKKNFRVFGSSRYYKKNFYKLNLNNRLDIHKFLTNNNFDVIINTSGLIDVDKCNKNFYIAKKFNTWSIENLSNELNKVNPKTHLIHFSTDQVYNNKIIINRSKETDINISNNYSKSKYLGELSTDFYKRKTILRTNFFGKSLSSIKLSFSDYLIKNLKKKKNIKVPSNIYFSPIHMSYVVYVLKKIIINKIYGIYNLGSSTGLSKYEFSKKVAKINNLSTKYISPYLSKKKLHQRPNGTIMCIKKIEKKLKIKIPSLEKSLMNLKSD